MVCVTVNVQFAKILPESLQITDLMNEENKILLVLVATHCVNYNTFLVTLIVQPTIIFVSTYFMLKV